jgi:hypothetical protein
MVDVGGRDGGAHFTSASSTTHVDPTRRLCDLAAKHSTGELDERDSARVTHHGHTMSHQTRLSHENLGICSNNMLSCRGKKTSMSAVEFLTI